MNVTTRTAPAGARMAHAFGAGKASASQTLSLRVGAGQVRHFATAAEMTAAVRRMEASAAEPVQIDPPPAPPNVAPDTGARLDAIDGQLADHEARLAALEGRSPPPSGVDEGAANTPADAAARAPSPAPVMVSGREIYSRMNAPRTASQGSIPTAPTVMQTSAGPRLDATAIYAAHNARAARAR